MSWQRINQNEIGGRGTLILGRKSRARAQSEQKVGVKRQRATVFTVVMEQPIAQSGHSGACFYERKPRKHLLPIVLESCTWRVGKDLEPHVIDNSSIRTNVRKVSTR